MAGNLPCSPTLTSSLSPSTTSSLNALFLCSGPKIALLNPQERLEHLRTEASAVYPASVQQLVQQAWVDLRVPSALYWSAGQPLGTKRRRSSEAVDEANAPHTSSGVAPHQLVEASNTPATEAVQPRRQTATRTRLRFRSGATPLCGSADRNGTGLGSTRAAASPAHAPSLLSRAPHPLFIAESFYPTRTAAVQGSGYSPHTGRLVIASDKRATSRSISARAPSSTPADCTAANAGENAGQKCFAVLARGLEGERSDVCHLSPEETPLAAVPAFLRHIPHAAHRHLYVLVDEAAPVDPFLDVDLSLPSLSAPQTTEGGDSGAVAHPLEPYIKAAMDSTSSQRTSSLKRHSLAAVVHRSVELVLQDVLLFFMWRIHVLLDVSVQHLVVLTSSYGILRSREDCSSAHASQSLDEAIVSGGSARLLLESVMEAKFSFHVHFRLAQKSVLSSIKDLGRLMSDIKLELEQLAAGASALSSPSPHSTRGPSPHQSIVGLPAMAKMLLACIDFGVYTRWRAFRLPYNVKAEGSASSTPPHGASCRMPAEEIQQVLQREDDAFYAAFGKHLPPFEVGSAAREVLTLLDWPDTRTPSLNDSDETSLLRDVVPPEVVRNAVLQRSTAAEGVAVLSTLAGVRPPPRSPADHHETELRELFCRVRYRLRFLLPLVPSRTVLHVPSLAALLTRHHPWSRTEPALRGLTPTWIAFQVLQQSESSEGGGAPRHETPPSLLTNASVNLLMDTAFIQRDVSSDDKEDEAILELNPLHTPTASPPSTAERERKQAITERQEQQLRLPAGGAAPLRLLQYASPSLTTASPPHLGFLNPFRIPRKPFPSSSLLVPVNDLRVKRYIAEVFYSLHPSYTGLYTLNAPSSAFDFPMDAVQAGYQRILPERLQVQFDKGSIRGYYVIQKQNKFCMRQNRCHKSTYSQLYLTYGSIKVRCYANDCYQSCQQIPWKAPLDWKASTTPSRSPPACQDVASGYPLYTKLEGLHGLLFPELPPGELLDRYGDLLPHSEATPEPTAPKSAP